MPRIFNPIQSYSSNVNKIKNRSDRSLLVINEMHDFDCIEIFQDDVAFFDEVTELYIRCKLNYYVKDFLKVLNKHIVKFHNLEYFGVFYLRLEPATWIEIFRNCTKLKELYFYGDNVNLTKEVFGEIFKLPQLEILNIRRLYLPFWPKGPSNVKYLELFGIGCGDASFHEIKDYENNFHTHENLTEINVTVGSLYFNALLISTLNLDKCLNLETITINSDEENLHESIHKILQLPKLKKISFQSCLMEYFVTDNSLTFPSVEEIYIGDTEPKPSISKRCWIPRSWEQWAHDKDLFDKDKQFGYPTHDNIRKMLKQCPNLKICVLDCIRHV